MGLRRLIHKKKVTLKVASETIHGDCPATWLHTILAALSRNR